MGRYAQGIASELDSALRNSAVVGVGYQAKAGGKSADVDVVADGGRTWIDTKSTEPFSTASTDWKGSPKKKGLRRQAEQLVEIAKQSPNPVDGKPPAVVYEFEKGVTRSVADGLKQIGKEAGVDVGVRGRILDDAKIVVPPLRPENKEGSDEHR